MKHESADVVALDLSEAKQIIERAALSDAQRMLLLCVIETLVRVLDMLEMKSITIARLRKMIFGAKTEKTSQVCGKEGGATGTANATTDTGVPPAAKDKPKRKGHGRNPAARYSGAKKNVVEHPTLRPGDSCPCCEKGKVRERNPVKLVRIHGQAPITGELHELGRVRCDTCGKVFVADAPEGVGEEKYDVSVAVMIAVLRYGFGNPFYRLARLQSAAGIPLSASTQWDILCTRLTGPEAAYSELIRQAAQGGLLHNDDTTMTVISLMPGRASTPRATNEPSDERTGVFTTNILALAGEQRIALFFTGHKHAGENLSDVLRHRDTERGPPIQMCDALSRNLPKEFQTILVNCLSHSRRRYVDVVSSFPDEVRHVLEVLRDVYRNDATARERKMSPQQRLEWHQEQSGPLMNDLETWLHAEIDGKLVEPNSTLGEAIGYMLDHWHALTQFLRVPGAPLDNNICERALKKAILHRKNSYFYRTERGAYVGDVFMSLIHTAELCDENPIEYLRALMENSKQVAARPSEWLPWNYRGPKAAAA